MTSGRDALAVTILRWAIVLIFVWFGWMKFLPYEQEGVAVIAGRHPLLGWLYPLAGNAGASIVIGLIELAIALLLALGQRVALASLVGGAMGVITFLITLSFMASAPGVWEASVGTPALGITGQFLIKDLVLLAGCFLLARDGASQMNRGDRKHA